MTLSALVGLALAGTPAWPHFAERTDSLWGFVSRSDLIVVGRVVRSQRLEEKGHTPVPGAIRLEVEEVLLGAAPASALGILVEGVHQPRYRDGERVLAFAERRNGILRSLQSRSEKVSLGVGTDPVLGAVRLYVKLVSDADGALRLRRLKELTLKLLRSPVARLHQDAVFDLARGELLDRQLTDHDLVDLGRFGAAETAPLVVREGIAYKLGALARRGRESALEPLRRLGREAANPAVRVAALNALAASGNPEVAPVLIGSLTAGDVYVRLAAAEGLGALRAERAVEALSECTEDPDPRIRFASLKAMSRIGGPEAKAKLKEIRDSGSPDERRWISQLVCPSPGRSCQTSQVSLRRSEAKPR